MPPKVPFVDNSGNADPWTRGKDGRLTDPPELYNTGRKLHAYTCFVGETDGKYSWLGCVKWGFKRIGKESGISADPEIPEWSCGKPEAFEDAVKLWNGAVDKEAAFPVNIAMP